MEGYLIRVPVEACFPEQRPAWRQRADNSGPVRSRVLYYVLEEGYLRGFESPDDVDEPVECFQLTSHRIEVNVMNSLNIFELRARAFTTPPLRHFVEEDSSSSSDSSDSDSSDDDNDRVASNVMYSPQVFVPTTPAGVVSGSFHVVFFAANKELVKKWSVKLLNWNRFVFGSSDDLDKDALTLAREEIIESLRVINAANRFLRQVEVQNATMPHGDTPKIPPPPLEVAIIPAPIEHPSTIDMPSESTSEPVVDNCITSPVSCADTSTSTKLSSPSTQPANAWWMVSFARSRKISSYSLRRKLS